MDPLNTQGFAPPITSPRKLGKKAAAQINRRANSATKEGKAVTMGSEAVAAVTPVATVEDRKIKTLRGIQSNADIPFQMEFFGGIGGGILAWVATKTGSLRARTVIKSITHAPVKALRETKLNEFYKLPAHYMEQVRFHAHESAVYSIAEKQVPKAERTWNPVQAWKNSSARKEEITKAIASMDTKDAALAGVKNADKAAMMAENAASRAKNLEASGAKFGATFYEKTSSIFTPIKNSIKTGLGKLDTMSFGRGVEKLTNKLPSWKFLDGVRGKNVSGLASSFKRAGGRTSLFAAIIGLGVTAGVGATILTARKGSKEARKAIENITADIGDPKDPLVVAITESYHTGHAKRTLGHTMSAAGDVVNGALIAEVGAGTGGMPVFAASMALPMVGSMLVKDDATLNAYANLKQADEMHVSLPAEQKVELVKQLISVVPSVAAHGGEYNKLTAPVAEAIVAKNLSTRDTMKLLANQTQFMSLAQEVFDQRNTEKETVADAVPETVAEKEKAPESHAAHPGAANGPQHELKPLSHHEGHAEVKGLQPLHHEAHAPKMTVGAQGAELHGKLAAPQHKEAAV